MSFPRFALVPTAVIALAVAAPASAVTGFGVSAALRGGNTVLTVNTAARDSQNRTCQKQSGKPRSESESRLQTLIHSTGRKAWVVACEYPPRSELISPLKQASANVFATIG